jgi:TonB family protein
VVAPPRVPNIRLPQTDRPYSWSVVVSVVLHLLVLTLFIRHQMGEDAREARDSRLPGAPGKRGGGGGQTFRIELPAYQREEAPVAPPVEKPPVPQVVVQPPPIKVQKLDLPTPTGTVTPGVDMSALGGQGPGKGGGTGTGVGAGVGVDSGSGTGGGGGDIFPPTPLYTILPPLPQPASMRGRTIKVHFWVSAQGKVTKVQVDPEIKDAAYRQQFLSMMREYTFRPARRMDGTTIEGELTTSFTL